jgi:hypothetical protein
VRAPSFRLLCQQTLSLLFPDVDCRTKIRYSHPGQTARQHLLDAALGERDRRRSARAEARRANGTAAGAVEKAAPRVRVAPRAGPAAGAAGAAGSAASGSSAPLPLGAVKAGNQGAAGKGARKQPGSAPVANPLDPAFGLSGRAAAEARIAARKTANGKA